MGERNPPEPS